MAPPLIYTVGRVIADLYANEVNVPLPAVRSFSKYVGGSSANTAVGLARLGDPVGLIARVGADPMGDFIRDALRREGVNVEMLSTHPSQATGLALAALFPPNDSHVWFCGVPNANAGLSVAGINFAAVRSASALVLAGTLLAEEPGRSAALALLTVARQAGVPVILDVDWRPSFWARPDEVQALYARALADVSVVLANEPELELVGGTPDRERACQTLLDLGVSEVVAKRGAAGSWDVTPQGVVYMPAFSISVLNTLGAGDGFAAGYVHGYVAGWSAEERLRWASACGALVVSRHSCAEAMPTRLEVETFLSKHGKEVRRDG